MEDDIVNQKNIGISKKQVRPMWLKHRVIKTKK